MRAYLRISNILLLLASVFYTSTIIKNMRSSKKSGRNLALALVGTTLFGMGCGGPSKEAIEQRTEAQRQTTEKELQRQLNPAMARVGRRAVAFAHENPDEFTWYKDFDDQWSFRFSNENNKHEVTLYLKKGSRRSHITSGDVEFVRIANTERIRNIFGKKYDYTSEVRIETNKSTDAPCGKGINASFDYAYVSPDEREESSGFITADRCGGDSVGFELANELTSTKAAQIIIGTMSTELSEAFASAR